MINENLAYGAGNNQPPLQDFSVVNPDLQLSAVLDQYHDRMRKERQEMRREIVGGRDGGQDQRMRAIGPQTGQLLNIMIRSLRNPNILEIGTSFGYSTLWLADGARAAGGKVTTLEYHDYKSQYAQEMAVKAGLAAYVDYQVTDALDFLEKTDDKFDFVFLDLWKDLYTSCLDLFYPKLNDSAIIVADNMIKPGGEEIARYSAALKQKADLTSLLLPVGTGIEVSVYKSLL